MTEIHRYMLDSFALLAHLGNEPGAERVRAVMQEASRGECEVQMSLINLGEVAYIVEREQGLPRAQAALAAIQQLPIKILPANQEEVFAAAHLKAHYRLSFADAFAASAAQTGKAVLLTGDPEFKALEALVTVEWLPKK